MNSTTNCREETRQRRKLTFKLFPYAVVCLAFAGAASAASAPQTHQCAGLSVTVAAATPRDKANICEGAGAAIAFFRSQLFTVPPSVKVKVQDKLPSKCGSTAVGCFFKDDSLVLLLPYSRFKEEQTLFRLPIHRRLYVSVAIHEVAHALAAFNSLVPCPSNHATEYVAYVAMFAAMDAPTRERILKAYAPAGPETRDPSPILFMFDSMQFGVRSYRHYLQEPDGPAFLHEVLSGRAMAD